MNKIIIDKIGNKDIGLSFSKRLATPDLIIEAAFAILRLSGNIPYNTDLLIIYARGSTIQYVPIFYTSGCISHCLAAYFG